jgi:hypothetical protein
MTKKTVMTIISVLDDKFYELLSDNTFLQNSGPDKYNSQKIH